MTRYPALALLLAWVTTAAVEAEAVNPSFSLPRQLDYIVETYRGYLLMGQAKHAEQFLLEAAREISRPEHRAIVYLLLADLYLHYHDHPSANWMMRAAAEEAPRYPPVLESLPRVVLVTGDLSLLSLIPLQLSDLGDEGAANRLRFNLAAHDFHLGRLPEAYRRLEAIIKNGRREEIALAFFEMGQLSSYQGHGEEAAAFYRQALDHGLGDFPWLKPAAALAAERLRGAGTGGAAPLSDIQKTCRRLRYQRETFLYCAALYAELLDQFNTYDSLMRTWLQEAVGGDFSYLRHHLYWAALLALRSGKPQEALDQAMLLQRLVPPVFRGYHARLSYLKAEAQHLLDRVESAKADLAKAKEVFPRWPPLLELERRLAQVHHR